MRILSICKTPSVLPQGGNPAPSQGSQPSLSLRDISPKGRDRLICAYNFFSNQNLPQENPAGDCLLYKSVLLEVLDAVFKDRLVLFTEDVLTNILGVTLGVTHLAENTAVRRGNALDGTH